MWLCRAAGSRRYAGSGAEAGVVESVKAASDVYAPIAGEIVAINQALVDAPEKANQDPYGEAWFFRIKPADANALDGLLDAAGYAAKSASNS